MFPILPNGQYPYLLQQSYLTQLQILNLNQARLSQIQSAANISSLIKMKQEFQNQILSLQMAGTRKIHESFVTPNYLQSCPPPKVESPLEAASPLETTGFKPLAELPNDPEICLEAQVKYMIQFFINNYGPSPNQEVEKARQGYAHDARLAKAFESLTMKYAATSKTREEMVKWIIRRVLKASKKIVKGSQKKDQKTVLQDVCKRYFEENSEDEDEKEKEQGWVDSVLPFRKNSKNKTMNSTFIAEIFESQLFKNDYKEFLQDFDKVTEKENLEKTRRFTKLVMECIKTGSYDKIAKYKRVPWLKSWIHNTTKVAHELDEGNYDGKASKKIKFVSQL